MGGSNGNVDLCVVWVVLWVVWVGLCAVCVVKFVGDVGRSDRNVGPWLVQGMCRVRRCG